MVQKVKIQLQRFLESSLLEESLHGFGVVVVCLSERVSAVFHGLFDLDIQAKGDLDVDIHHTNEDIGICLGQVFKKALGDCSGIKRFGAAEVPMDQARAKVAIDISNRYAFSGLGRATNSLLTAKESYSLEDGSDLLESFAKNLNINLHVDVISGSDLHHVLEAVFKKQDSYQK